MNSDFRVSTDVHQHPKIKKLKKRLGNDGFVSLIYLWGFTATARPRGILENLSVEDIEIASEWDGEFGLFIETLLDLKLLDKGDNWYSVHNWEKHNNYCYSAPDRIEQAREAGKASGKARSKSNSTTKSVQRKPEISSTDSANELNGNPKTVEPPSLPNPTKPNPTDSLPPDGGGTARDLIVKFFDAYKARYGTAPAQKDISALGKNFKEELEFERPYSELESAIDRWFADKTKFTNNHSPKTFISRLSDFLVEKQDEDEHEPPQHIPTDEEMAATHAAEQARQAEMHEFTEQWKKDTGYDEIIRKAAEAKAIRDSKRR